MWAVLKTVCNIKILRNENKIPGAHGLFTTTMLNTKATDSENVIPDFTTLPTKTALITKEAEV